MTATNSKTVSVSIVEGVMTICMSRPDARNSLNKEMMQKMIMSEQLS
jgi:enoyl-CoA hydratase/carnithine racemase